MGEPRSQNRALETATQLPGEEAPRAEPHATSEGVSESLAHAVRSSTELLQLH